MCMTMLQAAAGMQTNVILGGNLHAGNMAELRYFRRRRSTKRGSDLNTKTSTTTYGSSVTSHVNPSFTEDSGVDLSDDVVNFPTVDDAETTSIRDLAQVSMYQGNDVMRNSSDATTTNNDVIALALKNGDRSTSIDNTADTTNDEIPHNFHIKTKLPTVDFNLENGDHSANSTLRIPRKASESFKTVRLKKIPKSDASQRNTSLDSGIVAEKRRPSCLSEDHEATRKWKIILVTMALFLDNLLQTSVVPIVPSVVQSLLTTTNSSNATTYTSHNVQVSIILFIKPLTQLALYPLLGPILIRLGGSLPHVTGLVVMATFSTVFALSENYTLLCVSGILHGVGSAIVIASGYVLVAETNGNDSDMTRAISLANNGIALGFLVGYPYGGIAYTFMGHKATFLVLASALLLLAGVGLFILRPKVKPQKINEHRGRFRDILKDKYVLIALYFIFLNLLCVSSQDTTEPTWMKDSLGAADWQIGVIFVADACGYITMNMFISFTASCIAGWIFAYVGLFIIGVSAIALPFCGDMVPLIGPHFGFGLMQGAMDSTAYALVGRQAMSEHGGVFGKVYSLSGAADSLGYITGSAVAGNIVEFVHFKWIMRSLGFLCFASIPLTCLLIGLDDGEGEELSVTSSQEVLTERKPSLNSELLRARMSRRRRMSLVQLGPIGLYNSIDTRLSLAKIGVRGADLPKV